VSESESQDNLQIQGTVLKALPNALFNVLLENGHEILAHISGRIRQNNIKIIVGDKVDLDMSVYDFTKGRITYRHKK